MSVKIESLMMKSAMLVAVVSFCLPSAGAQQAGEKKKKGTDLIGMFAKQKRKAEMTRTTMKAKQIFYLMMAFDQDWGVFPNDATANNDVSLKGYTGKYSNDYLGQLVAGGYTKAESIFFVKGGSQTELKKPDEDVTTKAKTLAAGECGFAYYKGLSTRKSARLPLLMTPMTGKGFKFDPKPYDGMAVVLHVDGSVQHYQIDENGDAVRGNGKKLFEGGEGNPWGSKGPELKNLMLPR
ncbi:MAG: hypothetical protein KJO79_00525 [Verrucomicrobiae bacterium]|nr:hypothetical protein [Verrucomicrobiae bacterium]NNJ85627.1 hypothetical protein [Akkermansiaceae bacterium]